MTTEEAIINIMVQIEYWMERDGDKESCIVKSLNVALSALRAQQEAKSPCAACGYGGKHLDAPPCTNCPAYPKGEKNEAPKHGHIVWKERTTGGYKYKDAKCQICGSTVTVEVSRPMEHDKVPYCSKCGKRLDDRFMQFCPACGIPLDDDRHPPKGAEE